MTPADIRTIDDALAARGWRYDPETEFYETLPDPNCGPSIVDPKNVLAKLPDLNPQPSMSCCGATFLPFLNSANTRSWRIRGRDRSNQDESPDDANDAPGCRIFAQIRCGFAIASPVADAGELYSVNEGGSVVLSGANSSYAGGTIANYEWDLDNNGTYETTGVSPTFSAASIDGPTTRTVGLRVTSSDGEFAFDSAHHLHQQRRAPRWIWA